MSDGNSRGLQMSGSRFTTKLQRSRDICLKMDGDNSGLSLQCSSVGMQKKALASVVVVYIGCGDKKRQTSVA